MRNDEQREKIVGIPITSIWKDEELYNERSNIMMKYSNVNQENFVDYTSNEGIEYRFEPEKCVQELYDVLDAAIQKVLTDKNAFVIFAEAQQILGNGFRIYR